MGLDSVELVMKLEEELEIEILDQEAERISTIQDYINIVSSKKNLKHYGEGVRSNIQTRVLKLLGELKNEQSAINKDDMIGEYFNSENLKEDWERLGSSLELQLPRLRKIDFDDGARKKVELLGIQFRKERHPISKLTISNLVDCIVSTNYKTLIQVSETMSSYDIERVVFGVVSECSGIEVQELMATDSFTNDLGMD